MLWFWNLPFGRQNVHKHVLYPLRPHSTRTDDAGWSYGTETICQTVKNDSKNIKIGQKSFLGYGEFEFCKNFDFWTMFTRDTGPQSWKMNKKDEQKYYTILNKSKFDFFVFLGNSTMDNTNFNLVLMILWSITEKRVPENAKKTKIDRKRSKN
jgi:hypothetical protein